MVTVDWLGVGMVEGGLSEVFLRVFVVGYIVLEGDIGRVIIRILSELRFSLYRKISWVKEVDG